MQDTSFLDALNAVHRKRKLKRIYSAIAAALVLVAVGFGLHSVNSKQVASAEKQEELATSNAADISKAEDQAEATPAPSTSTSPVSPSSAAQTKTSKPAAASLPQSSGGVDKATFIANSNKILSNYSNIVSMVNFSPTDSTATKASRIQQAVALDKQSFSQVTSLRGQLASAGVSSGKYIDLTNSAENAVSKISVGLTFMNYWALDQTRNSDLNIGSGTITEGATLLSRFADNLKAL